LKRDIVSFNAAISACGEGAEWTRALDLMFQASRESLSPDAVTFASAIKACSRVRDWRRAVCLLGHAREHRVQGPYQYSAAMDAGDWAHALHLLCVMRRDALEPSQVCYNTAAAVCEKYSRWELSLSLLEVSRLAGSRDTSLSRNIAIAACRRGNKWFEAVSLMARMEGNGLRANVASFGSCISACRETTQWEWVVWLFRRMSEKEVQPDGDCYRVGLAALCATERKKDAMALYRAAVKHRAVLVG